MYRVCTDCDTVLKYESIHHRQQGTNMAGLYCRRTCEVELESVNRSHHTAIKDEEWISPC